MVSITGGAALAKSLFPVLGTAGAAGMRIVLAATLLLAVFRPSLHRMTRAQWKAALPYGVTLGLMNLCFYLSIARIPIGLAIAVEFIGPLSLAVFGSRHLRDFLWVLLAGVGMALLVPWSHHHQALDWIGVLLAAIAGVCWAAYILLGAKVSRQLSHGHAVAVGMMVAALTVIPFSLTDVMAAPFTPLLFAKALGVAVLSGAIPYTLEMMALRVMSSHTFGILMSLEPAVGAMMGLCFLEERLSATQWIAIVCVSAASAGATLTTRRQLSLEVN